MNWALLYFPCHDHDTEREILYDAPVLFHGSPHIIEWYPVYRTQEEE